MKEVANEKLTRPDRVRLTLYASADAQLEVWAAEAQAAAFEKTFSLPLEVRVLPAADFITPIADRENTLAMGEV